MKFIINIKEFEDKSITITKILLPNGNCIINTKPDIDLSSMNEFIGEEFIMEYNNIPRYKCVLTGTGINNGISQFNYEIVESL